MEIDIRVRVCPVYGASTVLKTAIFAACCFAKKKEFILFVIVATVVVVVRNGRRCLLFVALGLKLRRNLKARHSIALGI